MRDADLALARMLDFDDKDKKSLFRESMNRLSGDRNFRMFMEWIAHNLEQQDKENRDQRDVVLLHQGQGRSQVLADLMRHPYLKAANFD